MELFSQLQSIILIRLLLAHVAADFLFQPSAWVTDKKNHGLTGLGFYKHLIVVAAATFLAIPQNPLILFIIVISHALIDFVKLRADKQGTLNAFLIDQFAHLAVLIVAWIIIIHGWGQFKVITVGLAGSFPVLLVLLGYLFCIGPCNYIIKFSIQKLINKNPQSVNSGGRLIGIFERIIIFTLVLLSQYEAIGFLITGKSILRFGDVGKERDATEYVLVGTMISYALAMVMGALVNLLLSQHHILGINLPPALNKT